MADYKDIRSFFASLRKGETDDDDIDSPFGIELLRALGSSGRKPYVVSRDEERELFRLYAMEEAERFAKEAGTLPDSPTFDQDVADMEDRIKRELWLRLLGT